MAMTPLLPPVLRPDDAIGFFSPSSPATRFAPGRFARAQAFLQDKGFQLRAGTLTGQADYYRSGSIAARAAELNALIRDPAVRCIISTLGGSNSNALLPYLDYDTLRRDPKILIGYSDVTALLLGVYARTGLVTFYGPALVASFGEFPPLVDETFASFHALLCGAAQPGYRYAMPARWTDEWLDWESQPRAKTTVANQWRFIGQGRIEGRLIGGNLNTMAGIWGSGYMPAIEPGDILLLEDSLKSIDVVERAFAHLHLCGVFDRVGAVLLGKHEKFDDKGSGRTPLDVLLEVLNGRPLPIVAEVDFCHTHPMLTCPIGVPLAIDFDARSLTLTGEWLRR